MQPLIAPVDNSLIIKELTREKFLRRTNNGGNKLYIVTAHDSPNIMREIGRLRELTFRVAGGGTGLSMDIDEFDTSENPYKQLIVWDPKDREILGGYRFHVLHHKDDHMNIATSELFSFTDKFLEGYLPHMIELGRSFVQPNYQSTGRISKGMWALDNLWDGLGALTVEYPEIKYFFGKVTMYRSYHMEARNYILYFLDKYFADRENLVIPNFPIELDINQEEMQKVFIGNTYQEDYIILNKTVRGLGENIPPLINAYMNLSPSMKVFGTVLNPHFGDVEETGILLTISDIYAKKLDRHVKTFLRRPRFLDRLKSKKDSIR
ncbi:GNAT family N-acetyltransferase [Williamwhitmania taraxaci]|uniref:Putative hemolysin n=1 Tax=Williamwhitmania taraxaci TaxID=1640674 RepID=A0A1G6L7V3_9BACT|nr:GNAT family N-acetyltransferase [Williamwhitmania taraxaci]SDC39197.1 Putative hemolysin [Williamwhitmania taraxaci]